MFREMAASVENITFDIESALKNQIGVKPCAFPGMDKSSALVCDLFLRGECKRGSMCPYRHISGQKSTVCKHWLRGLCKKGDECEYLHEYNIKRMPECYFFLKYQECHNRDCLFQHLKPEDKIKDCPWYDRGHCRHGANCKNRHRRRIACPLYIAGFCPKGPECLLAHPSWALPTQDPKLNMNRSNIMCHLCKSAGHKAIQCNFTPQAVKQAYTTALQRGYDLQLAPQTLMMEAQKAATIARRKMGLPVPDESDSQSGLGGSDFSQHHQPQFRPRHGVVCFKCFEPGHIAPLCPKGNFLGKKS